MPRLTRTAVVAGASAAAAYLFDPANGKARRARLRDQLAARSRRAAQRMEQQARYEENRVAGAQARMQGAGEFTPVSDRSVVDEIRQVLARCDFPVSDVNVDVVEGCATLRGQLRTPEQIREVREAVARVNGVTTVESYLHLPGTPAPNKAEALDATSSAPGSVVH